LPETDRNFAVRNERFFEILSRKGDHVSRALGKELLLVGTTYGRDVYK